MFAHAYVELSRSLASLRWVSTCADDCETTNWQTGFQEATDTIQHLDYMFSAHTSVFASGFQSLQSDKSRPLHTALPTTFPTMHWNPVSEPWIWSETALKWAMHDGHISERKLKAIYEQYWEWRTVRGMYGKSPGSSVPRACGKQGKSLQAWRCSCMTGAKHFTINTWWSLAALTNLQFVHSGKKMCRVQLGWQFVLESLLVCVCIQMRIKHTSIPSVELRS